MVTPEIETIRLPDGRVLGFDVYGAVDGFPVFAFHGVPGTRLMYRPADAVARQHGLRLIAIDRPGFGRSTPQPGRQLHDWVPDFTYLADAFGCVRFGIVAISGGSPFAVATAAALGDRVTGLALVSPMGPVHDFRQEVALPFTDKLFFLRFARRRRALCIADRLGSALFRWAPETVYGGFVRMLPPADREILREPYWKAQVIEDVFESLEQGGHGFRDDLRIFSGPWRVDFRSVSAPCVLWQGLEDTIVPVEVALRLGEVIPSTIIHRIEGQGHFWVYRNFDTVLGTLAALIGRRDWGRS
jgi:pimeloyl-ACP methyl ester carboxylesterase